MVKKPRLPRRKRATEGGISREQAHITRRSMQMYFMPNYLPEINKLTPGGHDYNYLFACIKIEITYTLMKSKEVWKMVGSLTAQCKCSINYSMFFHC